MKRLCAILLFLVWALAALAIEKSTLIVTINGAKFYVHAVQPGQTLYALSKTYGVGESIILKFNPEAIQGLKAASKLKIPFTDAVIETRSDKKLRKTFDICTIAKGETLYAISKRYEIPIQTIMEDNPNLDPIHLRLGEQLRIRRKQIGSESEAEIKAGWESYRDALNSVVEQGYSYHIVQPGETFYSLARRFAITEEQLSTLNSSLRAADLKVGAMLKVPGPVITGEAPVADASQQELPQIVNAPRVEFHALRQGQTLHVALLLPISVAGDANSNYLEFYQGFLLGLDSVRHRFGFSMEVGLYNTGRDAERIRTIVQNPDFQNADLIIGPVYEEGLLPVVQFAEQKGIPVVSPLANITGVNSSVLFQLAPDPSQKYEKIMNLLDGTRRVTLIYTQRADKEFEQEIHSMLGERPYARHTYKYEHPSVISKHSGDYVSPSDLTRLLDNDDDNVFVVMSDNEVDVDRILAAIASANTSLTSRGRTAPRFTVLGNARWNRYNNLDRSMFFSDRVIFTSTYHAKRDSRAVGDFDKAYIRAFGSLPTLYSYRGYDAAVIFAPAMYGEIEDNLASRSYTPLQTTYIFRRDEQRGNHVNKNWTRVNYNSDYTITIE